MATQLSLRPAWTSPPPIEEHAIYQTDFYNKRDTFVQSVRLRKNLEESRKAFLSLADESPFQQNAERKMATKKISFKIKKTSSIYRRRDKMSTNTVQELAKKYNDLVEKNTLQPKVARLVRRVNSQKRELVTRKPSVKLKPTVEEATFRRQGSIKKKLIKKLDEPKNNPTTQLNGCVKATIAIFERKTSLERQKPKVPEKTFDVRDIALKNQEKRLKIFEKLKETKTDEEPDLIVQVVNIPLTPPKKCESRYETMKLKLDSSGERKKTPPPSPIVVEEDLYDIVGPTRKVEVLLKPNDETPPVPPRRPTTLPKLPPKNKIYEPIHHDEDDGGYEICESPTPPEENIYETLPSPRKVRPLPPRPPPCRNSYSVGGGGENESNFYESIYNGKKEDDDSNYESIYGFEMVEKRGSIISTDQQSNSIYGRSITSWAEDVFNQFTYVGKAGSELSGSSDKSDDWVDLSDHEETKNTGFVKIRERQKLTKKTSGWSQQLREQWNKAPMNKTLHNCDSDSDHHYESLYSGQQQLQSLEHHDDDFDSFDSDSESDNSFAKNDSGVDMGNNRLPEPPNQQTYVTRLAASAGKHMKRLRRNWSLTKSDITKSLSRMTKRKSRTDLDFFDKSKEPKPPLSIPPRAEPTRAPPSPVGKPRDASYQNVQFETQHSLDANEKTKTVGRKGFLNKFRRSMSISGDSGELSLPTDGKAKSTFYLTEAVDVDKQEEKVEVPVVNLTVRNRSSSVRPQIPPPPAPGQTSPNIELRKSKDSKRSTSWYAECGLFKNSDHLTNLPRRPNTFWYAEVGLYQPGGNSSPSTSSTENSGNNTKTADNVNTDDSENYYNMKNENDYYNESIKSADSGENKKDEAFNSLSGDLQLRLQDEPLYQFYDAAVLESVCHDGTSDYEYDGYEEVGKKNLEVRLSTRPSAMELVMPSRNNISVARTLWCEIPEVLQSTVLSTLSTHQKKLQEAKFEMLTSEASYLNSLNVLVEHFVKKLESCDYLTSDEKKVLFDKIIPVKECSEKLLSELEKCWQDNILLHGVCEIIKKHAEENFCVYVTYCENQILLDQTLKRLKSRSSFVENLRQLELSTVCQLLTLHSFLMLPMQRITRWPLLVDAVLKRLSPQDEEYLSCQYALATLNKIVNQCNEGARKMERVTEMQKVASQLEFGKGVPPIALVDGSRWLVRSGPLTQMQSRGEDTKLTFGKRFTKVSIHIFLFSDILIVAKSKGEDCYVVQHYCYRSYVEVNSEALTCLPLKDTQGRHLIFLTILENHEEKTVELLLSCNSETDRERWLEALSPPKSENPDETLYECWDCPQVTSVHSYTANQPDELALARGDIINVTRKMADGWYHGERIRDGETGWFPANYTVEIANPHVRARNLKQRYRLLAFSENYLKAK